MDQALSKALKYPKTPIVQPSLPEPTFDQLPAPARTNPELFGTPGAKKKKKVTDDAMQKALFAKKIKVDLSTAAPGVREIMQRAYNK